jgi:hypothetical protein
MSPPQHRKKDAKAEGRGPPDEPKDTIATFKALTKRLLQVTPAEVQTQQALYDAAREQRFEAPGSLEPKKRKKKSSSKGHLSATSEPNRSKQSQRDA